MRSRIWLLVGGVVVFGVLVGFFVTRFLNPRPPQIVATTTSTTLQGRPVVDFNLTTVAAVGTAGQGNGEHPNWVGYLPTTYLKVPAGAVVHMTIDQEDGQTGLRNEYFGLVRGTVNNQMTVSGKVLRRSRPLARCAHLHHPGSRCECSARRRVVQ